MKKNLFARCTCLLFAIGCQIREFFFSGFLGHSCMGNEGFGKVCTVLYVPGL